ncbi:unnamed protein product [Lactuca saligna]|uniref:Replication factor A C-terminal domain-containing protein n=1 Tax=Lactuca saligna TaxID=75948 RepID=A0AA36EA23_LACSI|nr:unnamed protein product [Lactuca saligna]
MEHITPIKEIDSIKDDFTIKVRIIHLWTQKSKFNAKETYSIEMILMDEEGRKIHASCVKKWFPKFKRYLKEDISIYVKKPNVAPNTLNFKFADPERKLNFYHDTTVKECENFSGSAHGFDFVDFNTIVSNNIMESKSFGRLFSSTYFDVSRLFINNDIDEITSYKNKLVSENGQQLSSSGIKMIASKQNTEHDDFLKNHMFSNIDDLFEPLEEKTVIIVGTVKGIRQNIRWYYLACSNCYKSAKEKESSTDKVDGSHEVAEIVTYKCSNPNCKNIKISVIPRFKIPLRVQDNTGTLTLTLFDQEAKKLFKYTAKELYDKNKKHDNSDSFIIGSSDIASQETKVVKDSFSHTGENLTPCARDNSTATSPTKLFSTPTELKRNLATCIDLDEMENLSTSKTPRLSPPDE